MCGGGFFFPSVLPSGKSESRLLYLIFFFPRGDGAVSRRRARRYFDDRTDVIKCVVDLFRKGLGVVMSATVEVTSWTSSPCTLLLFLSLPSPHVVQVFLGVRLHQTFSFSDSSLVRKVRFNESGSLISL